MSPALNLFIPTPNASNDSGDDAMLAKWIPNPQCLDPSFVAMYEFVGKLMGIAMRTKNPLVVDLPSIVWKQLCGEDVQWADIAEIDQDYVDELTTLERSAKAGLTEVVSASQSPLRFATTGSDGEVVELLPGGQVTAVSKEQIGTFVSLAQQYRVHELDTQCAAIARGIATQVPRNILTIFTWTELELMVCGPPEIDVEVLRLNTVYGEGINEKTPAVEMFWQVLEEFSREARQNYIRFVWGRSRLPFSTVDWERKHKINKCAKSPANDYLPTGHTCFFTLDLPQYTTKEICREKLLYAVTHCIAIDADETTVARQAAEGGEWQEDDDEED